MKIVVLLIRFFVKGIGIRIIKPSIRILFDLPLLGSLLDPILLIILISFLNKPHKQPSTLST